jgi:hypothetical protein
MARSAMTLLAVVAFITASVYAAQNDTAELKSLKAAVEDFNRKTPQPIGKPQPPLTEDEVIAAIRGWVPEHTPGLTNDIYNRFQEIAETRKLPKDASLSKCSGWIGYRGFRFEVWWIDLSIKTGEKTFYTFRIRDQKISSRKMTPDELAQLERDSKTTSKSPK